MKKKKVFSILLCVLVFAVITACFSVTAFAAGDVASAIESTWKAAQSQINSRKQCCLSCSGYDFGNLVFR